MNFKKHLALLLCIMIFVFSLAPCVYAEDTITSPELSAEDANSLVDAVILHLSAYSRYEDVTSRSLYQAALKSLIKENPALYDSILKAVLESIDEYSEYYTPDEAKTLTETVNGEITGIGVTIEFIEGSVATISSIIPDTPAERAGLQVGDVLIRADGIDLTSLKSETILSLIRGDAGTTVHIEVDRHGAPLAFDIIREPIIGTSVTHSVYQDGEKKVFYIRVHGFVKNTAEKFAEALKEASSQKITDLIIDLRDNGGGILDQAVQMAQCFVPKGKPITTEDHKNPAFNKTYMGYLENKSPFDIVLLVNENSASASEVFAAALHENQLATIIGTDTYGKGTIQSIVSLATGGLMKYTSGFYLTPSGKNINGIGLAPDTHVENSYSPVDMSKFGTFMYDRVHKEGDTSNEIKTAKEILDYMGIYRGEINEVYDRDLYYAVHSFQTRVGLFPYGVLDLTTQLQLINHLNNTEVENDDQLDFALSIFDVELNKE